MVRRLLLLNRLRLPHSLSRHSSRLQLRNRKRMRTRDLVGCRSSVPLLEDTYYASKRTLSASCHFAISRRTHVRHLTMLIPCQSNLGPPRKVHSSNMPTTCSLVSPRSLF